MGSNRVIDPWRGYRSGRPEPGPTSGGTETAEPRDAALDIESIEVIKGSNAVKDYGEDGKNGVIVILTRQSAGNGKGDGPPGEPSN